MNDEIRKTLTQIAQYDPEKTFGSKEENVKQFVMIPILECFGHKNRLDFEHGTGREIDIFVKDLPRDCKVIVETKRLGANLNDYLTQLKGYVHDQDVLLAILTNGEEIRIYSPIRGYSFPESCLYVIRRRELNKEENINILERFLQRENLTSHKVKEFITSRENEIVKTYQDLEKAKEDLERRRNVLESEIDELRAQTEDKTTTISHIGEEKEQIVRKACESLGFRMDIFEPVSPSQITSSESGRYVSEVTIGQLLRKGLLKDGKKIYRSYGGKLHEATITAEGKVRTQEGKIFNSLSGAADHITGGSINGWTWWKCKDEDGNECYIDELRKRDC